jgi:hypothetical protein
MTPVSRFILPLQLTGEKANIILSESLVSVSVQWRLCRLDEVSWLNYYLFLHTLNLLVEW